MKMSRKVVCVLAAWMVVGLARLPFESGLAAELRQQRLVPPELEIGTRDKIGQTSSAVALGGLRTLVATFLNLRAFTFFTEQKWVEVAQTFDLIVDLAPRTRYYWDTGSWHQAYNAASYYLNDSKLPALRRREAWRASIYAGKDFLERGVQNNPKDWRLWASLGFLLSDPNKFPAFPDQNEAFRQSAEAYRMAYETGEALDYVRRARLYSLARVQGEEGAALELARALFEEGVQNRTPTLLCLLFALESHQKPHEPVLERAIRIFGTEKTAYDMLSRFWMRTKERFPVYGVAHVVEELERKLEVPPDESVLRRPLPPPWDPRSLFEDR